MKKKVLIGVGLVVVASVIFISHKKAQNARKESAASSESAEADSSLLSQGNKAIGEGVVLFSQATVSKDKTEAPVSEEKKVAWTQEELSEAVRTLLGLDGKKHNYPDLLQAIAALGYDLSAADVAALREMLTYPNDRFPSKMRPIEINAVKNDVLDRLLRQKELSEGLGLQMAEMAADPDNDPVWRDYSIQFMGQFYDRFAEGELAAKNTKGHEGESALSADESTAIRDAMFQALEERDETLAGTSLIGLELLSRTHEEFDRPEIVAKSLEIASDETASSSCRLTALRLASLTSTEQDEEGLSSVANTTRLLAQTGETFLLRSAAIVTLGEVGSVDDRELLESFTFSENKQIVAAAQMALKKMDARN